MGATAVPAFVQLLLANEAGDAQNEQALIEAAERVCEKLQVHLAKRIGREGFRILLARALRLAAVQHSSLSSVRVGENGNLEGLWRVPVRDPQEPGDEASEITPFAPEAILLGAAAVVTHLLGLLITFIGEDLTLRIFSTLWPLTVWPTLRSADVASDEGSTPRSEGRKRMNERGKVALETLSTGVPDLDAVLGGGLPEYSFNIIAGAPGTGKTTPAHQIMFANATPERPALYFTVLGEPTLKMLRYQQQFEYFDSAKVESAVRLINLSDSVLEGDLNAVLERIIGEVEAASPGFVFVDSFRTLIRKAQSAPASELELQAFVQRLALYLTSWQATTFLIGEYSEAEIQNNAVFTVADGLFWLTQSVERNSVVRKFQVVKLRGQESMPGLHTFRITRKGLQVFPRTFGLAGVQVKPSRNRRVSTGIAGLDEMLGGGIPAGDSVLVAGPSGSGKSALASQFLAEGARQAESGVITIFEERPQDYVARADHLGLGLQEMIAEGKLKVLYLRPLDLSVDEALREVLDAVRALGAQRVVIDSMNGFELALAPAFREDFRESLYRMIVALTGAGVTVMTTVEVAASFTDLRFSPHAISFLSDDIILQRYVEIDGQLRRVMMIVKMRGSGHSKDIREYEITPEGMVVGERLLGFHGLITGNPKRTE